MTHTMKKIAGMALLSGGVALAGLAMGSGTAQAFNPQPDPPGRQASVAVNQPPESQSRPGTIGVNPQSRIHVGVQAGGA